MQNSVAHFLWSIFQCSMKKTDITIVFEEIPSEPSELRRHAWDVLWERLLERDPDSTESGESVDDEERAARPPLPSHNWKNRGAKLFPILTKIASYKFEVEIKYSYQFC